MSSTRNWWILFSHAGNGDEDFAVTCAREAIAEGADVNLAIAGTPNLNRVTTYGHAKLTQLLIDHGAQVNVRDEHSGQTPLHEAILALRPLETSLLLLQHNADPTLQNKSGATPLHENARTGDQGGTLMPGFGGYPGHRTEVRNQLTDALLEKGAFIDALNNKGETPLHCALNARCYGNAQHLLKKGANPNGFDEHGNSFLHIAISASACRAELVELLLEKGADPSVRNRDGMTPLEMARKLEKPCSPGEQQEAYRSIIAMLAEKLSMHAAKERIGRDIELKAAVLTPAKEAALAAVRRPYAESRFLQLEETQKGSVLRAETGLFLIKQTLLECRANGVSLSDDDCIFKPLAAQRALEKEYAEAGLIDAAGANTMAKLFMLSVDEVLRGASSANRGSPF